MRRVLVAMTYGASPGIELPPPDMLRRAVDSVLAQTYHDLRLVIYGDGHVPPIDVDDARITVHVATSNRGTYFGHEVMLRASPCEWYAPVDADDWVEPDHIETVLAVGAPSVVVGAVWFHPVDREPYVLSGKGTWWVGAHRTEVLRDIGGFDPTQRIGQDGLTQVLLRMHGGRKTSMKPTYHRVKRHGSLTLGSPTRLGSRPRRDVRSHNARVVKKVRMLSPDWQAVRAWRESHIPPPLLASVEQEASRLREALA